MSTSAQAVQTIADARLIVVLRYMSLDGLPETATALREAGVRVVEVAMNSAQAVEQLHGLRELGFCVGAGTILAQEEAEKAARAGAQFLFSPCRSPFFLPFCQQQGILGIAGGLTPTEIYSLSQQGCELIKLFPCVPFGPDYVRQILAPCPSLRLIPTGGVTLASAEEFLLAGAAAVAVGTEIANPGWVVAGRFDQIAERAHAFVAVAKRVRNMESSKAR